MKRKQERLRKCLAAIERRRQESASSTKPKAIASTTDPDSRVIRDKEGRSNWGVARSRQYGGERGDSVEALG